MQSAMQPSLVDALATADRSSRATAGTVRPAQGIKLTGLSVAELRRAFVLSEVLQPPLALRTHDPAGMSL